MPSSLQDIAKENAIKTANLLSIQIFLISVIGGFTFLWWQHTSRVASQLDLSLIADQIRSGEWFATNQYMATLVRDKTISHASIYDPYGHNIINYPKKEEIEGIDLWDFSVPFTWNKDLYAGQNYMGSIKAVSDFSLAPLIPLINACFLLYAMSRTLMIRKLWSFSNELIGPLSQLETLVKSELLPSLETIEKDFNQSQEVLNVAKAYVETQLRQSRERQRNLELEKYHILADASAHIAHDLRGSLGIIEQHVFSQKHIDGSVQRAFGKIYGLMDAFRCQDTNLLMRLQTQKINWASYFDEWQRLFSSYGKAFYFVVQVKDVLMTIDMPQMERVFINLCKNAAESDATEVTINVRQDPDFIVISVIDNGSGVPKEWEPYLFQRGMTTKGDGTGLGLAFAKSMVNAHNGTLIYQRIEGKTHFITKLPYISEQSIAFNQSSKNEVTRPKAKKRIALRIDHPEWRVACAKALKASQLPYTCDDASWDLISAVCSDHDRHFEQALAHGIPHHDITSSEDIERIMRLLVLNHKVPEGKYA